MLEDHGTKQATKQKTTQLPPPSPRQHKKQNIKKAQLLQTREQLYLHHYIMRHKAYRRRKLRGTSTDAGAAEMLLHVIMS
jgi:hypothetical protein